MVLLQVIIFLLLCSVALGWVSRRSGIPYPIVLVLGGGALGFVPGLPALAFDPQFLLVLVLPPILYQAALLTSWRDFKANLRPIGFLAIGLVVVTTLAVGAALKLAIPEIPWAVAFVLGAIVSPPDAVAATTILSRLTIPRYIVTVLEGESLVNDASGLVIYKFAVAAVLTGAFSIVDASVQFAWVSLGGVAIGMLMAWVFIVIHRHIHDAVTEVLLSLSIPYVAYILAESFHLSGVLAVVAAGLVRGRFSPEIVSAEMRILARSMWNIFVFLLNSLIFMLIGMQLYGIIGRLHGYSMTQLATIGLLISVVAIGVRFVWVYLVIYLPRWFSAPQRDAAPQSHAFIMSWCGMRGIVSLAAALALPVQINNGLAFPYRDTLVFLTFVVIAVTLVLQGLTLSPLIRKLHVASDTSVADEHKRARRAMGEAAVAAITQLADREGVAAEVAERIRSEFVEKSAQQVPGGTLHSYDEGISRRLRLAAIQAERGELIRVWRENLISDDVLHHIEEELDYQESHL